ncbi:MAG TPA: polysaccharide deacetylase, partial [Streptomyces sp.]|nr:polysaccharide deacetylase [Streptomyces sp.]
MNGRRTAVLRRTALRAAAGALLTGAATGCADGGRVT